MTRVFSKESNILYVCRISRKTNISYLLIGTRSSAYQRVRNFYVCIKRKIPKVNGAEPKTKTSLENFACSRSTIETLENSVKYVPS